MRLVFATVFCVLICSSSASCPEGFCPDNMTCCDLELEMCCPFPNAVCCSDGLYCCPEGMVCNLDQRTCDVPTAPMVNLKPQSTVLTAATKELKVGRATIVVCPDSSSFCDDGNTCCQMSDDEWGCCPFPSAVCCPDKKHCCPSGMTCNSTGSCSQGSNDYLSLLRQPALQKTRSKALGTTIKEIHVGRTTIVVCPDSSSFCDDGNTCCHMSDGEWGCCPLPSAVCCSDKESCCPSGTTCGSTGSCSQGSNDYLSLLRQPALKKTRSKTMGTSTKDIHAGHATIVVCPNNSSLCPSNNTCCQMSDGKWGCCPLPSASCCSDKVHCCPSGTVCDSTSHCIQVNNNYLSILRRPVIKKTRSNPLEIIKQTTIICPEGFSCSDLPGSNCCPLPSGDWRCCAWPSNDCCGTDCCM